MKYRDDKDVNGNKEDCYDKMIKDEIKRSNKSIRQKVKSNDNSNYKGKECDKDDINNCDYKKNDN